MLIVLSEIGAGSIVLSVGAGLVILCAAFFIAGTRIGKRLPPEHVVTATLHLDQPPPVVFALVDEVARQPEWDKGTTSVEMLEARNGQERYRLLMGRNSFVLTTIRREPPRFLTREIDDDHKFFGGRWEFEFIPEGSGTRVVLTEHGIVKPALPRFMMKYVVDPTMYLKRNLGAIARHFGEKPRISDCRRIS